MQSIWPSQSFESALPRVHARRHAASCHASLYPAIRLVPCAISRCIMLPAGARARIKAQAHLQTMRRWMDCCVAQVVLACLGDAGYSSSTRNRGNSVSRPSHESLHPAISNTFRGCVCELSALPA